MIWFVMSLGTTLAYAGVTFGLFWPDYITDKMKLRAGFKNSRAARWMCFALTICSMALTVYIWVYPYGNDGWPT